ncbi:hypothetical protein MUG91_G214n8 [Manis pentadactyla]|nr:hypothetical protein MUG91_G214n8 [Manis pentadactyla]
MCSLLSHEDISIPIREKISQNLQPETELVTGPGAGWEDGTSTIGLETDQPDKAARVVYGSLMEASWDVGQGSLVTSRLSRKEQGPAWELRGYWLHEAKHVMGARQPICTTVGGCRHTPHTSTQMPQHPCGQQPLPLAMCTLATTARSCWEPWPVLNHM